MDSFDYLILQFILHLLMGITIIDVLLILLVILAIKGLFVVSQQNVAVIQRFGKFVRTADAGLNFMIPFIEKIAGKVNLRVDQLDVKVETKTEDNVFLHVLVSVQFFVHPDRVYEAYYKLQDPARQITSFVFDVVRARVPKICLDDVFEKKDDIADAIKEELSQVMNDFGYGIVKALVTDIDPDKKVKESMNEINAAQRMRVAATEKGEADRIIKVKLAEAEAQSKALEGRGMADQRSAIIRGLKESVADFKESLSGISEKDILNLVLLTQYFDTLKDLGNNSNNNTIMIPHSPSVVGDIMQQITNSLISANQVVEASNHKNEPTKATFSHNSTSAPKSEARSEISSKTSNHNSPLNHSQNLQNHSSIKHSVVADISSSNLNQTEITKNPWENPIKNS